jgi:hypothetical protein
LMIAQIFRPIAFQKNLYDDQTNIEMCVY